MQQGQQVKQDQQEKQGQQAKQAKQAPPLFGVEPIVQRGPILQMMWFKALARAILSSLQHTWVLSHLPLIIL